MKTSIEKELEANTRDAAATARYWSAAKKQKITKMAPVTFNAEFVERVKHCMLPDETPMQFISRTGLGPAQAKTMSREEITAYVQAKTEQNRDDATVLTGQALERKHQESIRKGKILIEV